MWFCNISQCFLTDIIIVYFGMTILYPVRHLAMLGGRFTVTTWRGAIVAILWSRDQRCFWTSYNGTTPLSSNKKWLPKMPMARAWEVIYLFHLSKSIMNLALKITPHSLSWLSVHTGFFQVHSCIVEYKVHHAIVRIRNVPQMPTSERFGSQFGARWRRGLVGGHSTLEGDNGAPAPSSLFYFPAMRRVAFFHHVLPPWCVLTGSVNRPVNHDWP
jgi:hypothetical protein